MDIAEFIRARLDEDEAVAREAASALPGDEGYGWEAVHRYLETHPASGESFVVDTSSELVAQAASARSYDRAVADHIARHDPARVLREVEAKRAILAEHQPYDCMEPKGQRCHRCASDQAYRSGAAIHEAWPCVTLRALAAVYSDHPDYRQEWAPER